MIKLTIEDHIKHIFDKIENDEELRKLSILIDQRPELKDEILQAWANDIMEDAKLKYNVPPHVGCKQNPGELCRQVDELYKETFGDLGELFKMVPKLNRFEKDML